MQQRDRFTAIGQPAGIDAIDGHPGILGIEGGGIAREQIELPGRERRSGREREGNSVETQAPKAERIGAGILEFKEFVFITVGQIDGRRMIHDFRHEQFAQILRRIERHFVNRAPDATN